LAEHGNAPQARLDQATDSLHEAERAVDQARSAYEQAVNGYTREEREIAVANVGKALADIKVVESTIDQMVVYAPVASQVYQRNVEPGEYVSPGVLSATVTPLGQLPFFIEYLKQRGLFDGWVAGCPMHFTSPNAPSKRDVLGTGAFPR
jgi:HlyD family secretion protein